MVLLGCRALKQNRAREGADTPPRDTVEEISATAGETGRSRDRLDINLFAQKISEGR